MKPLERALFREKMIKLFLPDPVTPEKLTEPQLEQLYIYLRKKYINEQAEKEP
jgi:hypothetical protein